jgi:hypothetical protein
LFTQNIPKITNKIKNQKQGEREGARGLGRGQGEGERNDPNIVCTYEEKTYE